MPVAEGVLQPAQGRAGRTAPGVSYRLYTEEEFENRPLFTKEEIYRRDLSEVILRMADLGIRDFERFDFVSNPGSKSIAGGRGGAQAPRRDRRKKRADRDRSAHGEIPIVRTSAA